MLHHLSSINPSPNTFVVLPQEKFAACNDLVLISICREFPFITPGEQIGFFSGRVESEPALWALRCSELETQGFLFAAGIPKSWKMAERVKTPWIGRGDPPRAGAAKANKQTAAWLTFVKARATKGSLKDKNSPVEKVQLPSAAGREPLEGVGALEFGECTLEVLAAVPTSASSLSMELQPLLHSWLQLPSLESCSRAVFGSPGSCFPFQGSAQLCWPQETSALGSESIFLKSQNGLGWKEP